MNLNESNIVLLFQDAVKIMAKDLVRTRRYVKKFMLMKANIQAVSLKIQTLRSQNAMAQAMKGVTKAMQNMNRQVYYHYNNFYNKCLH
jgi:charged multivesicular body protein 2A